MDPVPTTFVEYDSAAAAHEPETITIDIQPLTIDEHLIMEIAKEEEEVAAEEEEEEVAAEEEEPKEIAKEEPMEAAVEEEPEEEEEEKDQEIAKEEPMEEEPEEIAKEEEEVAAEEEPMEEEEEVAAEEEPMEEEPEEVAAEEEEDVTKFSDPPEISNLEPPETPEESPKFSDPPEISNLESPETPEIEPEGTESPKETPPQDFSPPQDFPSIVFIVPYRDRKQQQELFDEKMRNEILVDYPPHSYEIFYVHQVDLRPFNRGAMKNIGFLTVKHRYPNDYQNITLVFNDVDTFPVSKDIIPSFQTEPNTVKHFYGYTHALGGIFSINARDFERVNGFPNYWSWGYEDNMMNQRVQNAGMLIDRSVFFPINDTNHIQQNKQNPMRTINRAEFDRYSRKVNEGIQSLRHLKCNLEEDTGFVNVYHFITPYVHDPAQDANFDTSKSNTPFMVGYSTKRRTSMNMLL